MRFMNLTLALLALAGVVALALRDPIGETDAGAPLALASRLDEIDHQLSELTKRVEDLLKLQGADAPKLLGTGDGLVTLRKRIEAVGKMTLRNRAALKDLAASPSGPQPGPPPLPPPGPKQPKKPKKKGPVDQAQVDKWLEALQGESNDHAFSAAIELARLGDMRAVDPLMRQMKGHKDFYVRLAAATALGELRAPSAVFALIDQMGDQDQLVCTAAAEAVRVITKHKFKFSPSMEEDALSELQTQLRDWWRENEIKVIERLRSENK